MNFSLKSLNKIPLKKLKLIILGLSFSYLIIGILSTKYFFDNEIIIYDPRYIQLAHNLFYENTFEIRWGIEENPDSIMVNPYNIQKGIYYNWFPIGYGLVIFLMMLISSNYLIPLILFQIIIFSFIPLLIFNIGLIYWQNSRHRVIKSFIVSILSLLNPYYAVSPLWQTDTWFLVLLNIFSFYLLLKIYESSDKRYYIVLIITFLIIFLIRPLIIYSYIIFFIFIMLFNKDIAEKISIRIILFSLFSILGLWGLKNYIVFNFFDIGTSNSGYNLWLSNNEYTNEYLKSHLGDGGMIEDFIIPKFDNNWAFLSKYSEYEKDRFFKEKAVKFIIDNPVESLENSILKFLSFFSPFRIRSGHWSDSSVKNFLTLVYQLPLNVIAFISLIYFLIKSNQRQANKNQLIILYLVSYILPYFIFFSMIRFKMPINFLLIIISVDFIYKIFFKKYSS